MMERGRPGFQANDALRERALVARGQGARAPRHLDAADATRLLHELEVHQIELEMQNEQLKQAQVELAGLYERYYELYEHAPVGYLTVDRSGTVKEANLTLVDLLGVERARLVGRPFAAFMQPSSADTFHLCLQEAFVSGRRRGLDVALAPCGSRGELPAQLSVVAFGDDETPPEACRVAVVDLSELRAAQRRRCDAEAHGATLLDTTTDAIVSCDASGKIESFNRAAERLFGYEGREILGKNVCVLMPSPHRGQHHLYMQRYLSTGAPHIIGQSGREVTGLKNDGTEFPLELGIGEWLEGDERKFVVILHDLTKRKRVEADAAQALAQFHQSQKMEALGTLASGVAHDFSNLLMGIGGCTNIALSMLPAESAARMYLEEIRKSTEGGAAISRRLLDFTRKKNGTQAQVFELDSLVASVRGLLARMLSEEIELIVRAGAEDSRVRADPALMEQVLVNLASNARDAMPKGGRLTLETQNIELFERDVHVLPGGRYVVLSVIDTGCGMDAATRQRVFEPFFTTKPVGQGTGLGLSMIHGLVRGAGGAVEVESAPSQGSMFRLFFPVSSEAPTPDSDASLDPDASPNPDELLVGTATVLLVEDDPAVRLGTKFYLERGGYRVLEAASGEEALECCVKYPKPIELMLTDVVLPGTGGREIAERVREIAPGTRVLYMSAHPAELLERQGRIEPGAHALEKPFGPETLLSRVKTILEGPSSALLATGAVAKESRRTASRTVLVVEDQSAARLAISAHLREAGWKVVEAQDARTALLLGRAAEHDFAALLIDHGLPDIKGDALARDLKKHYPEAALVYMSGYPALQLDPPGLLLVKPLDLYVISETLQRLLYG